MTACESRVQETRIAAQDFRFVPAEVRFHARDPVRLVIVNEGREPHEFTSPLLSDPQVRVLSDAEPAQSRQADSLRILPGRAATVTFQAPPGTYLFRCQIRGHAGMYGMIIIE